ncbi:DUF4023 domain-containing protein [Paenibacillus pini]|nr:DUF4023 domain-containing protein [Paenibacillus pini]
MTDTHEFVEKVHETQEKDRKNKEHNGKGQPNSVCQLSNMVRINKQ